jgi:hypothetical protein
MEKELGSDMDTRLRAFHENHRKLPGHLEPYGSMQPHRRLTKPGMVVMADLDRHRLIAECKYGGSIQVLEDHHRSEATTRSPHADIPPIPVFNRLYYSLRTFPCRHKHGVSQQVLQQVHALSSLFARPLERLLEPLDPRICRLSLYDCFEGNGTSSHHRFATPWTKSD